MSTPYAETGLIMREKAMRRSNMEQVGEPAALGTKNPRLGNVTTAAAILDVPKSWIYDRTRRNAIPAGVMLRVGKYVRFDLNQLLEWAKLGCPESWQATGTARAREHEVLGKRAASQENAG